MLVMASMHRSDNLPGSVDIMNTLLTWQCLRCTSQWILCIHVDILKIGVSLRCVVEDLDGPKTVEEKLARLAKIRLLKQFSFGVIAYVLATALVVLLPIFVSPEVRHARSTLLDPRQERDVACVALANSATRLPLAAFAAAGAALTVLSHPCVACLVSFAG